MALDLKAIADGLAARFKPAAITPPTGYQNIRDATAAPPNNIPAWPYVVVFPPSGELTNLSQQRKGEHEFPVVFLYGKTTGDDLRDAAAIDSWIGVLLDAVNNPNKLDISPPVDKALITQYETGTVTYAGVTYLAITLTVRVWTTDTVALVP